MNKKTVNKVCRLLLCLLLAAVIAIGTTGCSQKEANLPTDQGESSAVVTAEVQKIGEGETSFEFQVIKADGTTKDFLVSTNKKTVGEALLEVGLIAGDVQEYGLYVKSVDGTVADYDIDKTYWAFYENGNYAMAGVDKTDIAPGVKYAFKIEK